MRELPDELPTNYRDDEDVVPKTQDEIYNRAQYFDSHPEEIEWQHLENILGKMPGSLQLEVNRKQHRHEPIVEVKKQLAGGTKPDFKMYSRKYLDSTYDQFYNDVITGFERAGVDVDEFEEQNKQLAELPFGQREKQADELKQRLVEVYQELRHLGYRHRDLVT